MQMRSRVRGRVGKRDAEGVEAFFARALGKRAFDLAKI
jgi:hypothetical protein